MCQLHSFYVSLQGELWQLSSDGFHWFHAGSVKNMNDGATPDFSYNNDQETLRKRCRKSNKCSVMNNNHGVLWNPAKSKCTHLKAALTCSFMRLFKLWSHGSRAFEKRFRQELFGDYNANVRQKSSVSHILTMRKRYALSVSMCFYIHDHLLWTYFSDVCLIQLLALKNHNHFQWRSRKQSRPANVKCLRLSTRSAIQEVVK